MSTEERERLDSLLRETAEARDDDRYLFAQYAVIIGAAVVVITAMASVYYFTCSVSDPTCHPNDKITAVSDWIYVGAPLLPIALIAYTIFISAIATLRSYYLRTIELEILNLTDQKDSRLQVPSWSHITLEVTGQSHAGGVARLNLFLIYGIVLLMVAECLCLTFGRIYDPRLKVFALTTDAVLASILFSAAVLNVARGALIWKAALGRLPHLLRRTASGFQSSARPKGERSLFSFLLLPRNQEELLKALFIPICFGIGWLAPDVPRPSPHMIWHFLGFFFVFEFIMYQGRYLLNDVRDRKDDREEGAQKQRFPRSCIASDSDKKSNDQEGLEAKDKENEERRRKENQALTAAFTSFIVRWVLAALIVGCLLPIEYLMNRGWVLHAFFLVTIFVIAALYEAARNLCKTWAVAASKESRAWRTKQVCTLAVILIVGLGYGLRATVGLWLAGADYTTLERIAIGASLFGSTFVALTWALESTKTDDPGKLITTKAHLLWFRDAVDRAARRADKTVARGEKVLIGWQSPLAPWAFFAVLATGALAYFTFQLFPDHHPGPMALISTGILAIAVLFPLPITFFMTMLGFIGLCVFFSSAPMSISGALATFLPWPRIVTFICGMLAALIPALPTLVTCSFRGMCFDDLPGFGDKVGRLAAAVPLRIYRWFAKPRKQMSIFHRVPLRRFEKPENVFRTGCAPVALLVDLEGTLTEFSPSLDSVKQAVKMFDEVASQKGMDLRHVHYVTNAALSTLLADCPSELSGRIHVNAHKPCFDPAEEFQRRGTIVVGDQYLTDGLLAWRHGFEFALVERSDQQPSWPRIQRSIGRILSAVFFREVPPPGPTQAPSE